MQRNELRFLTLIDVLLVSIALTGCGTDDNSTPVYGASSGLPVNCRAYVQVAVDGYRAKKYTAEETMSGLERNCGLSGSAWKDNREK
jgi:hypothetical protein